MYCKYLVNKLEYQREAIYEYFKDLTYSSVPLSNFIRRNKCYMDVTIHSGELIVTGSAKTCCCILVSLWMLIMTFYSTQPLFVV